ncbi:zincin [Ramaria rubella]|nr:zincin [Ramaria rubella]
MNLLKSAPLLRSDDEDEPQGLFTRCSAISQEPLTPLTKLLLAALLVLLILTSVFLGLFVGVEQRLSAHNPPTADKTSTATTIIRTTTTVHPSHPTSRPEERPCLDSHCVVLAASILTSLDTTQDPCEDFYGFANGGWLKANPLPNDKGSYGSFEEVTVQNQRTIQQILTKNSSSFMSPDAETLIKLQDLYQSCLAEDFMDSLGINPLKDVVNMVKKLFNISFPSVGSLRAEQHILNSNVRPGLTAAVAYLHSRGIGGLFAFDVEGDAAVDPNEMVLWFYQPELGLPSKEYFEENSTLEVYTSTITRIFSALEQEQSDYAEPTSNRPNLWPPVPWPPWGDDDDDEDSPQPQPRKTPRELAVAVVTFEREIARASLDLDLLQQDPLGTYNPMSFSNFSASIPEFDFPAYWSTFAPRSFPNHIIVTYPTYLQSLSTLLARTAGDVLEGYLVARVSLSLAEYLGTGTQIWKAHRELIEELTGIKKGTVGDREEYCSSKVESAFGFATGRFFVKESFSEESKSQATQVINGIVEAFKESLSNLDWMDQSSAEAAFEKASAIRIKVGYPISPDTLDAHDVASYYSRLTTNKVDFFGNMLRARVFTSTLNWAQLGKRRNQDAWLMVPSEVNAYYNAPANEIVFPAGILRTPFFSEDWPSYLTYGAFGQVAAHELTHAFDSAGRFYDQEGKLREWWTNTTSKAFEERRECISRQYSNYTVKDGKGGQIHVNNIGDQGLIQAHRAWKAQFETSFDAGNEYLLPGMNYTRDQLFFISFGRAWAQNIKPETAVQRVRSDPHSPNIYRVIGTLVNMPEFAAAFNCPIGSKFNLPEEKRCKLW